MAEKKALYFDAGATEVWLCQLDGALDIFTSADPEKKLPNSPLFPISPSKSTLPKVGGSGQSAHWVFQPPTQSQLQQLPDQIPHACC